MTREEALSILDNNMIDSCDDEWLEAFSMAEEALSTIENIQAEIQDEMLEYHRAFVLAGRSDFASVVANCLNIVNKHINGKEQE